MKGLGFGTGFGVQGLRFRVWVSGFGFKGCRSSPLGLRALNYKIFINPRNRVPFQVLGQGLGLRV